MAALAILSLAGCRSGEELSQAELARLQADWQLYVVSDPIWDSVRDRWYERGGAARRLLIDLLARDLAKRAMERGWERPQRELQLLPREDTVARLIELMRSKNEPAIQRAFADTLVAFVPVEELLNALENPRPEDARFFRHYALKALVRSGGARALEYAGKELSRGEWENRAAAADALALARFSERQAAAEILAARLPSEQDPSVLRRILVALRQLDVPRSAPAVADLLDRRDVTTDPLVMAEVKKTLRALCGVDLPDDDVAGWKHAAYVAADSARPR